MEWGSAKIKSWRTCILWFDFCLGCTWEKLNKKLGQILLNELLAQTVIIFRDSTENKYIPRENFQECRQQAIHSDVHKCIWCLYLFVFNDVWF